MALDPLNARPMRPPFSLPVDESPPALLRRIQARISCEADGCCGQIVGSHVHLMVGDHLRHVWSPYLSLEVEAAEGGGSLLVGRFGPHPSVWTLWVALYALASFGALAAGVFGVVQVNLGSNPWGFFGVPLFLSLILLLYVGSLAGQTIGARQMHMLEDFLHALVVSDADAHGRNLRAGDLSPSAHLL